MRATKDSGADWLGEVPVNWHVRPLKRAFQRVRRELAPELGIVTAFRDGQVTLRSNRRSDGFTEADDYSNYQRIEPDDLAIHAMDAFAGAIGVCDSTGMCSPVLSVCSSLGGNEPRYMAHVLRLMANRGWIEALSRSIRERTSEFRWAEAGAQQVPIPPIEEQRRIADFLDRETAKIDTLIAKQEQLITTLDERRHAVIRKAITRGLSEDAETKESGIPWVGPVCANWTIAPLKYHATTGAGSGFPIEEQGLLNEELPFIKVNSLGRSSPEGLIQDFDDTVSRETAGRLGAKIFPAGSIVLAKIGAALLLGRIRQLAVPSCIDNNMMAVTANPETSSRFLFYLLNLIVFERIVNPGAVPSTSEGAVKNLTFPFPGRAEQDAIANYLDGALRELDAFAAKSRKVVGLLGERRQALISAAVTGKLEVFV